MKIVFAGSPGFAVPVLKKLIECGKEIVAVLTRPDRPVGRKQILTPTPVKAYALSAGLPVYDFKARDNCATLKSLGADIMITCAYGAILSEEVLKCFKGGVWNIHASLLPEFRGASPIQSAILAGATHTGVTVMKTELALDSGDILLVKRCATGDMTCGELSDRLSVLGAEAAVETVGLLERGDVQLLMQDEAKATYCKKIQKEDGKINFSDSPEHICRLIRAFSPAPAAFCNFAGNVLNIYNCEVPASVDGINSGKCGEVIAADKHGVTVRCGGGAVVFTDLQLSGGKRMKAADFVNGRKIKAGDVLD